MSKDNYFLLSALSHDLKNYMAVIEAVIFNLRDIELDAELKYSVDLIDYSKCSMMTLLDNTLNWTKLQNDKLVLNNEEFNIHDTINNVINMFNFNATQKDINLNCNINIDVPLCVIGDEIRLKQILINLISNSIKYTTQCDVEVLLKTLNDSTLEVSHIECKVIDTGSGIPPEDVFHIFDMFKTNDPKNGSGIGLTITKELVELMGGKINVISSSDGTTFTFDLYVQNALVPI